MLVADRSDKTVNEKARLIHQYNGQVAAAGGKHILTDISDLVERKTNGKGLSFADIGCGELPINSLAANVDSTDYQVRESCKSPIARVSAVHSTSGTEMCTQYPESTGTNVDINPEMLNQSEFPSNLRPVVWDVHTNDSLPCPPGSQDIVRFATFCGSVSADL